MVPHFPTPRKTRFISHEKVHRIFELTHLRSDQWTHNDSSKFCQLIRENIGKNTCGIVADFGHGLFEGPVLKALSETPGFVALNVQTNSSNHGFNPFTKHRRFSYLSLDTNEVRVAYHDRFTAPIDLVRRIRKEFAQNCEPVSMTLGASGAYYFPNDGVSEFHVPAFTDRVVDATGAGDAYFGLTSLLVKVGCPDVIVPFLGNCFAGLKTKIVGNKSSVSRSQLIKAVTSILK